MVYVLTVTRRILYSELKNAKPRRIVCRDRTRCRSRRETSYPLQLLQAVEVPEKKEDSKQKVCSNKMDQYDQYDSKIWKFLDATLEMQFLLISPAAKESKFALLITRCVSMEFTMLQKVEVTGKPLSPLKTKTSPLETLKLTVGSFKKAVRSLPPGKEACTMCQEVIRKKRFFDERRFGLLRNCDHAICYGCVRKLCESPGDGVNLSQKSAVALGPVHCPECDVVSDEVAASSKWIVGEEKIDFFKSFNKNFRSDKMIKQITKDYKNLDVKANMLY